MDRRDFLKQMLGTATGTVAWSLTGCQENLPALLPGKIERMEGRPGMNILFVHTQNLSTQALGCYGNSLIKTPNIDRLARQGIQFNRAYCAAPMGHPSRISFFTGLRPDSTGIYTNEDRILQSVPARAKGMAGVLRERGAYQVNIGDVLSENDPHPYYHPFDQLDYCRVPENYLGKSLAAGEVSCPDRRFQYSGDPVLEAALEQRAQTYAKQSRDIPEGHPDWWEQVGKPYLGLHNEILGDSGMPETCEMDYRKTHFAADLMRTFAEEDRQFFLSVGLTQPHVPLVAPQEYVALYDPEAMKMPASHPDQDRNMPAPAKRFGAKSDLFTGWFDTEFPQLKETPQRQQEAIAAYYAAVSFVDAQIGTLLETLKETKLDRNTIVICLSDHGFHLGEHGLWGKQTQFEEVTRVPLIVYAPEAGGNGSTCDQIVELVDLLPTLCDMWALKTPDNCEGMSFLPLLEDPAQPWKRAAFNVFQMQGVTGRDVLGRTVRTKRYRYTEWGTDGSLGIELYDLDNDSMEQHNQAYNAKYKNIRERLAQGLRLGWRVAIPELPDDV